MSNNQHDYIDTKEFIKRAVQVHGDIYRYDLVIYTNINSKVLIYCNTCKEYFEQLPHNHLYGKGCKSCAMKGLVKTKSTKEYNKMLERLEKGSCALISMKDSEFKESSKLNILCTKHGESCTSFIEMKRRAHSCNHCTKELKINNTVLKHNFLVFDKFKNIYGAKYDYSKFITRNVLEKSIVICPKHGEFIINSCKHLSGQECPECTKENNSHKRGGFTKDGWLAMEKENYALYLTQLENKDEIFYKIGISTNYKKRFTRLKENLCIKRYMIIESEDGNLIYDLEKNLHKEFDELKYIPSVRFKGWTECFNPDERIARRFNTLKKEVENGISLD